MAATTVFYGASVTSRTQAQAKGIVQRAAYISSFLEKYGYQCLTDVVLDAELFSENAIKSSEIPDKYLKLCSPELLDSLTDLRIANSDTLKNDLACHLWGRDVMKSAGFCIWDLTLPSTGAGFEIASALAMNKKCFCFSDNTPVSSTISGCPSPLLRIASYGDNIGQLLLDFFGDESS
ncbi:hypothetical protein [Candidatus Sororendozoicomonas aggregata]|uniref:hypothetical protein n=1 Tax=Candidatus Sororendozoicomonas aggregata TaxID=3073239 RepID=UPI002ED21643